MSQLWTVLSAFITSLLTLKIAIFQLAGLFGATTSDLFCCVLNERGLPPPQQLIQSLIQSIQHKGYSDIVVDIGHDASAEADAWRSYADVLITVCEADHNALMRFTKYRPAHNEFVLINKAEGDSEAIRTATRRIRELAHLSDKVLSFVVPRDEFAAQSSFMNGPVVQLAAFAESARVISALGTWLTIYERRRG